MTAPQASDAVTAPASPLAARLAARIARLGPMSVADYMAEALTDPAHGYYMRSDPFGARGDFITAPEISQMFGELIGLWCVETWRAIGAPDPVRLVELGPGRGTLMADALRAAGLAPDFLGALRLHLVEVSPALRDRQRAALAAAGLGAPPTWHDRLDAVPDDAPLLLIANEFFDALPVRQFERRAAGWSERVVTLAPDRASLAFAVRPADVEASVLLPPAARDLPDGAIVEVSPASIALAREIGRRLAARGGAALIVDYGAERPAGEATLQALRRHARHDVLREPGSADLTAHVDFATLAQVAEAAGAKAWGPVPQGRFLAALGLAARAEALARRATPAQVRDIAAAVRRLTGPGEMGWLFKALALAQPGLDAPAGFA